MLDVWNLPPCYGVLDREAGRLLMPRATSRMRKASHLPSGLYRVVAVATTPDIEYSWASGEWIVRT